MFFCLFAFYCYLNSWYSIITHWYYNLKKKKNPLFHEWPRVSYWLIIHDRAQLAGNSLFVSMAIVVSQFPLRCTPRRFLLLSGGGGDEWICVWQNPFTGEDMHFSDFTVYEKFNLKQNVTNIAGLWFSSYIWNIPKLINADSIERKRPRNKKPRFIHFIKSKYTFSRVLVCILNLLHNALCALYCGDNWIKWPCSGLVSASP